MLRVMCNQFCSNFKTLISLIYKNSLLHKEHQCNCFLRVIPIEIVNESKNESGKIKSRLYEGGEKKSTASTNGPGELEVIFPQSIAKEVYESE